MATTKKVLYKRSSEYRTVAASGVWAGPTPSGNVMVDFFVERFEVPQEENLVIDQTTGTAHPPPAVDTDILRESQIGILLRADTAYIVGKFLMERALLAGYAPPKDDE